jgi:nucleoside 2-deoxyribosyltransferase
MTLSIYLAGPEVFHLAAGEIGARKRALCAAHGFVGLFPLEENELVTDDAVSIYRRNLARMHAADVIIANLTPFRGPSADPGTVYELGWMIGRGKRALAYSNDPRDLAARVAPDGLAVEDFGLAENLMLACGLSEGGFPLLRATAPVADPMLDFTAFEACLRLLKAA